jgi:hypothetical protein
MSTRDWTEQAKLVVNRLTEDFFAAHRGAVPWRKGIIAIFGNDGYSSDERTKKEVAWLRQNLADLHAEEVAFATDEEGYSWVLLVRPRPCDVEAGRQLQMDLLEAAVWRAWRVAHGHADEAGGIADAFEVCQFGIASSVLADWTVR